MSEYRTLCALSIKGTRVEKGQIITLDEDFAKGLASDLEKIEDVVIVTETIKEEVAIDEMSISDLRAKAKELGLSTSGSKADLVERISLANEENED